MPLAVSATTRRGRSAVDVDERHDVLDEVGEQVLLAAVPGTTGRHRAPTVEHVGLVSDLITPRSTGNAPAWHSLMPLYSAGLCDAVNIAAGSRRLPDA